MQKIFSTIVLYRENARADFGLQSRQFYPDPCRQLVERYDPLFRLAAQLHLHTALGEGAFADRQPDWNSDQVGIIELDTGAFIAVVI